MNFNTKVILILKQSLQNVMFCDFDHFKIYCMYQGILKLNCKKIALNILYNYNFIKSIKKLYENIENFTKLILEIFTTYFKIINILTNHFKYSKNSFT